MTFNDDGQITSHRFDSMAIDGDGRVMVAWIDGRGSGCGQGKRRKFSGMSLYTINRSKRQDFSVQPQISGTYMRMLPDRVDVDPRRPGSDMAQYFRHQHA